MERSERKREKIRKPVVWYRIRGYDNDNGKGENTTKEI